MTIATNVMMIGASGLLICFTLAIRKCREYEAEISRLRKSLSECVVALDDWAHTDAPNVGTMDDYAKSKERIRVADGALAYATDVRERAEAALKGTNDRKR